MKKSPTHLRTISVLFCAVVLSMVVAASLDHFLMPNGGKLLMQTMTTRASGPEGQRLWSELRRSGDIAVYFIAPLQGLIVGIFVGVLQKNRATVLAAIALVPDFLYGFLGDHARLWSDSVGGILVYIFHHSLPFITAILAAAFCKRLTGNDLHRGTNE